MKVVVKRKRKRRKSRRAKRGIYTSSKTGQVCHFRSSWEEKYLKYLDDEPDVVTFKYEPFPIPYISNAKTKKVRKYYPDLYVEMVNGEKLIVEIKPSSKLKQKAVMKKSLAALGWCLANGMKFVYVTEKELTYLGLL